MSRLSWKDIGDRLTHIKVSNFLEMVKGKPQQPQKKLYLKIKRLQRRKVGRKTSIWINEEMNQKTDIEK